MKRNAIDEWAQEILVIVIHNKINDAEILLILNVFFGLTLLSLHKKFRKIQEELKQKKQSNKDVYKITFKHTCINHLIQVANHQVIWYHIDSNIHQMIDTNSYTQCEA